MKFFSSGKFTEFFFWLPPTSIQSKVEKLKLNVAKLSFRLSINSSKILRQLNWIRRSEIGFSALSSSSKLERSSEGMWRFFFFFPFSYSSSRKIHSKLTSLNRVVWEKAESTAIKSFYTLASWKLCSLNCSVLYLIFSKHVKNFWLCHRAFPSFHRETFVNLAQCNVLTVFYVALLKVFTEPCFLVPSRVYFVILVLKALKYFFRLKSIKGK